MFSPVIRILSFSAGSATLFFQFTIVSFMLMVVYSTSVLVHDIISYYVLCHAIFLLRSTSFRLGDLGCIPILMTCFIFFGLPVPFYPLLFSSLELVAVQWSWYCCGMVVCNQEIMETSFNIL